MTIKIYNVKGLEGYGTPDSKRVQFTVMANSEEEAISKVENKNIRFCKAYEVYTDYNVII